MDVYLIEVKVVSTSSEVLSAHSDPKYVMKGVKHSACDYLLQPIRIEEFKNISL